MKDGGLPYWVSVGLGVGVAVGFALFAWARSKKAEEAPVVSSSEAAPAEEQKQ